MTENTIALSALAPSPGWELVVLDVARLAASKFADEPGSVGIRVYPHADSGRVMLVEYWATDADFANHAAGHLFADFTASISPRLRLPMHLIRLDPFAY